MVNAAMKFDTILHTLLARLTLLCGLAMLAPLASADAPLADLIQQGDSRGAQALLQAGANVNAAQPDGSTPLLWAVYQVDICAGGTSSTIRPSSITRTRSTFSSVEVRWAMIRMVVSPDSSEIAD
jgi:hypothetical protein